MWPNLTKELKAAFILEDHDSSFQLPFGANIFLAERFALLQAIIFIDKEDIEFSLSALYYP